MPMTSPIPVLRGAGDAVLRSDGDALLLSRPDEETRIPLRAVRRVRTEGGTVVVELTAPEGDTKDDRPVPSAAGRVLVRPTSRA
ncbi:hypothetical protein [Streptomyces sp. NPDC058955]|uniref:hypothetical protein n=1 Tax=unclassified Streptomyces TaxID=2593676 RepID=UPI00364BFF8F